MTEKISYKETLNLPQTSFPMKAALAQREPEMLKKWENDNLYQAIRKQAKGKKKYILHDGPPYANGHIHIGHALNKILKDIIIKFKTLQGYDAFYVPGWDCHGLPIEHQCLKEMGKRKEEVERVPFRKQARQYAEKFVAIQRDEFKRLGIYGEWDKPYLTMSFDYQAAIAESFLKIYEEGYVEQRLKPVPWCFDCETALADAELEYQDKTSKSVYVKFDHFSAANKMPLSEPEGKTFSFLVWTTTPWTLPANVGLAVHPELKYCFAETNKGNLIFAEALTELLKEKVELEIKSVVALVKGSELEKSHADHPFIQREARVITADYVSAEDGTGIVHIAPGHGEEDYQYGNLKSGLEIISPVDEKGRFTKDFEFAQGIHVFKANEKITGLLKEKNALLAEAAHQHSYPHCWRCKKPIIFRATPQWFMKIDHKNLRAKMTKTIEGKVKFTPDWGKNRIGSMVETRPDWCLSRQRYWGVPIPILSCEECGKVFVSESKKAIIKAFKEKGADVWFETEAAGFLGGKTPSCCGQPRLKKETDIIDVWFDSGVSHQAVLKQHPDLNYPADLYLEGSDQHRGWFQSALTTAMALEGSSPFHGVLTHGFVVDGDGKKMSKSSGNVVSPQDVMKEFGADILRLWVASCDYQFDVRLSKAILRQMADSYRKIRNTFRYILGNLYDFDPKKNTVPFQKLHPLDQWAVQRTQATVAKTVAAYEEFNFHRIYRYLNELCTIDLSSYYFDILKDTLYTAARDAFLRRSAQTAMAMILNHLTKMITPILPFTADEVWQSFQAKEGGTSALLEVLPAKNAPKYESSSYKDWDFIRQLRDALSPSLEKKREEKAIGSSLDAKIYLEVHDAGLSQVLKSYVAELPRVFIVSQVYLEKPGSGKIDQIDWMFADASSKVNISVSVQKADGVKCSRCWNYSVEVGKDTVHPELCGKCVTALKSLDKN